MVFTAFVFPSFFITIVFLEIILTRGYVVSNLPYFYIPASSYYRMSPYPSLGFLRRRRSVIFNAPANLTCSQEPVVNKARSGRNKSHIDISLKLPITKDSKNKEKELYENLKKVVEDYLRPAYALNNRVFHEKNVNTTPLPNMATLPQTASTQPTTASTQPTIASTTTTTTTEVTTKRTTLKTTTEDKTLKVTAENYQIFKITTENHQILKRTTEEDETLQKNPRRTRKSGTVRHPRNKTRTTTNPRKHRTSLTENFVSKPSVPPENFRKTKPKRQVTYPFERLRICKRRVHKKEKPKLTTPPHSTRLSDYYITESCPPLKEVPSEGTTDQWDTTLPNTTPRTSPTTTHLSSTSTDFESTSTVSSEIATEEKTTRETPTITVPSTYTKPPKDQEESSAEDSNEKRNCEKTSGSKCICSISTVVDQFSDILSKRDQNAVLEGIQKVRCGVFVPLSGYSINKEVKPKLITSKNKQVMVDEGPGPKEVLMDTLMELLKRNPSNDGKAPLCTENLKINFGEDNCEIC